MAKKKKQKRIVFCPYCKNKAINVTSKEFYGRDYQHNLFVCYECDARVGTHKGTNIPKGTLADKELRELRMQCHQLIDPYWRNGIYSRTEVYDRLSKAMNLPKMSTHIGKFNKEQCQKLIGLFN